jgi:hypothetical protein
LELRKTSVADLAAAAGGDPATPPESGGRRQAEDSRAAGTLGDEAPALRPALMADLDVAVGAGGYLPGFVAAVGPGCG